MNILIIGNSFSQDAVHYLHRMAEAGGVEINVTNLYYPGCSLAQHREFILYNKPEYRREINGLEGDKIISVPEAVKENSWDYVITQQASHESGFLGSYFPYLDFIADYVRQTAPGAELILHETWAYETDSMHGHFYKYENSQQIMYDKLSYAYREAARKIGARLIPSGDMVQKLRGQEPFLYGHGGMSLCRDGFHMNLIYGRYLLSAIWYKFFTGKSVCENPFVPHTYLAPNAVCDEKVLSIIKTFVDKTAF